MTYELHPLCTLFPRLSGGEFDALVAFSGVRNDGLALADFRMPDEAPGYWHFSVLDVPTSQHLKSRKPIASHGVALVLDQFGGAGKWSLTPCSKAAATAPSATNRIEHVPRGMEIVYFLRAGDFIKIGKATGSPKSRIATLQTGCPFQISVLAYMPGGLAEESALHQRFAALRTHGEWFRASPDLLSFIDSVEVPA